MKISGKAGRRRTVYGWITNGACFLSPFSSFISERPRNVYATKEEAEAEARDRNLDIVWEDAVDG